MPANGRPSAKGFVCRRNHHLLFKKSENRPRQFKEISQVTSLLKTGIEKVYLVLKPMLSRLSWASASTEFLSNAQILECKGQILGFTDYGWDLGV